MFNIQVFFPELQKSSTRWGFRFHIFNTSR